MFLSHKWDDTYVSKLIYIGIMPFTTIAVNCFVLISGWFGIKLNWRKLLGMNWMVTFWAITIGVLAVIMGLHDINVRKDVLMLFPVITKRYWFITVYVVLCIIAPYLNKFVNVISQGELKRLLYVLFAIFVVLPSVAYLVNSPTITNDSGYGLVNFIMLYLLGRYLKLYYKSRYGKWIDFAGYILCMACCGLFQLTYSRMLGFDFTTYVSYDTIFCFVGALFLFLFFSKLNFHNKIVNWLATFCLAVYVIHIHPWTFDWVYEDFLGGGKIQGWPYLIFIVAMPFFTLIACVILESVRRMLFSFCGKVIKAVKAAGCQAARCR